MGRGGTPKRYEAHEEYEADTKKRVCEGDKTGIRRTCYDVLSVTTEITKENKGVNGTTMGNHLGQTLRDNTGMG